MKFGWRGALGIVLSAACLYFAFKDIDVADVMGHVRRANVGLLILSAIVATLIFPVRARRWRPILDPIAPNLAFGVLWRPTAIGMMVNNVVPARAGELARAYALSRSTPAVPFPAALASLVVDRIFDAMVVLLLMFAAMLDPAFPAGANVFGQSMTKIGLFGVLAVSIALAGMYTMVLFPDRFVAVFERVIRRIAPRLEDKGRSAIVAVTRGLSVLRTPSRFASVFAWTVGHWLLNALAFWIGFKAVGIDAPYTAALFLQGIIAIGVAAPQAPGFFGIFELFGKEGLSIYGVDPGMAVTWAIGFHFVSFIPITLIGAWYFVRAGLSMDEIGSAQQGGDGASPRTSAATPGA